jgi:RNA polymerase primary sigma factor
LPQRSHVASSGGADSRGGRLPGARLSPTQERELVAAAEGGDRTATRELVEVFLPAIGAVARRFEARGQVERAELMQEGVAGLLVAAKRYDPRTGTPFWGYASFWVRKAMQELVAEVTRPVALSDHAVRGLAQVNAARREHLQAAGAEPTREQISAATGLPAKQIDSLLATDRRASSVEEFGETIADPGAEHDFEHVLDEMEVRDLADRLDERERRVLWGHYGLGRPPKTLSKIGADLGLTAERVRQIEADALEKLRSAAAEPPGPDGRHI